MTRLLACLLVALALPVQAVDVRATLEAATILFDAPSLKGQKQFILSRDTPVEIIVQIEGWSKVREAGGAIAWVERKALGERKHLQVKLPYARQQPEFPR
jgi:SH3-like domain-containing protein